MNDNIITSKNYFICYGITFNYYFDDKSNKMVIEMADGQSDILFIPSKINDIPVSSIEFIDWKIEGFDKVVVSGDNPYFKVIDGVLFSSDMKELLIYPPEKKDEIYYIPDGVEIIGEDSFMSNKYVRTIVFPNGFREIVQYALTCCKSLETIYFPKTLEKVLLKAFYFAESVKNVYFEGTEQEWKKIFFADCNWSLTNTVIHFNYKYNEMKFWFREG